MRRLGGFVWTLGLVRFDLLENGEIGLIEDCEASFAVPDVFVTVCREFVGAGSLEGGRRGGGGCVGTEVVFGAKDVHVGVEVVCIDGSVGAVEGDAFYFWKGGVVVLSLS